MPARRIRSRKRIYAKERLKFQLQHFRKAGAHTLRTRGLAVAKNLFGKSHWWFYYWKKKEEDPNFHPNSHGGARNYKFNKEDYITIWSILWRTCNETPTTNITE